MSLPSASSDSPPAIAVRTPCRLHFGLFSFGQAAGPQYGGVGAMVEPPAVEVTVRPAEKFKVVGTLAHRGEQFARAVAERWQLGTLPNCQLEIGCPPDHTGLGVGTQLALAVAAALRKFLRMPDLSTGELASSVGRGLRSAIGTYGFQQGGLIVDAGKQEGQLLGTLARRVELPSAWRFVLVRAAENRGLAGASEIEAFDRLPPVPGNVTQQLWRITEEELLPAAEQADCAAFGEAVYQFGRMAGECFAGVQSGPFASPAIERLVETIRSHGITGVGQSSWGPTVFAIAQDEQQARSLVHWLSDRVGIVSDEIIVARPNNTGAHFSTL